MSTDAHYKPAMIQLLAGHDLTAAEAEGLMASMMEGALSQPQVAALLTGLAIKGVTADELAGFARTMRDKAVPLDGFAHALDTCGTGGSGLSTINTSTMCAFIVAAGGVAVAKHGNRSSSGKCGSADVLERLGVPLGFSAEIAAGLLRDVGVSFLFAPAYHPAMKHVVPVRRAIGFPTVFNFLGPLCNPARTRRQVIGVSNAKMAGLMAQALRQMGTERALVVHGEDGLDELSMVAATRAWHVSVDEVTESVIKPESVGFSRVSAAAIAGGDVAVNAGVFEAVLRGKGSQAHRNHVLLNAGAGLWIGGVAGDLAAGVKKAIELVDSGAAWGKFVAFRNAAVAVTEAS